MNLLPFEICNSILSLLDYKSCLECSVVCKLWHQQLDHSGLLLKTIQCNDLNQHQAIIRFFKYKAPELCKKVHTLQYATPLSTDKLYELGQLFPNIEEFQHSVSFSVTNFNRSIPGGREQVATTSSPLPYWAYLKRLRESSSELYLLQMLENTVFENLVHLDLDFTHLSPLARDVLVTSSFKNAPNLESLTLRRASLSYNYLDQLHEDCQCIKEIILLYPIIMRHPTAPHTGYYDPLPSIHYTPKPADTVKHIKMMNIIFEGSIPLLSYIAAKYKRLETLVATSKQSDKRSQNHALELRVDEMKEFVCDLVDMTPQLLQRFTALELTSFEILSYMDCKETLSILSSRFRHTLKNLVIKSSNYTSSCSRYVTQLDHLESLVIESKLSGYQGNDQDIDEDYTDEDYEQVDGMNDELEEEPSISLEILNHLPKLKHLSIGWFQLEGTTDASTQLETLKLMDCTIKGNANQFFDNLFSSCLHLEKLTLFLHHQQKRKIRLCLKNHQLLDKIDVWIKGYPILRYHEDNENKAWFDVERAGKFVTYYPGSKKKSGKYFVLECSSTKLFYTPQRYNALYH
jgi:hypothetical protein